jgi:hypothetical protein
VFILNILGHYPEAVKWGETAPRLHCIIPAMHHRSRPALAVATACLVSLFALPAWSQIGRGLSRPRPPAGVDRKGHAFDAVGLLGATIVGLPAYLERHGSGPTAAGMVLGYHDGHGFPYLIPGDASTQTELVNMIIASEEHYDDYALPLDVPPDLLPDKSELPQEERHADNCLADFFLTSRSFYGNYYGWTKDPDIGPGIEAFFQAGERYVVVTEAFPVSSSSLTSVRNELESGRPPVFAVDTDGDGVEDRFVAVAGVNSEAGIDYYGCYTGWDTELHWYEFRPAGAGIPWGIATVHVIAPAYGVFPPADFALERLVNDLIFFKEYINRLSWAPNPENLSRILRYKLYRRETFGSDPAFALLAEVDASSTAYDDRGLKAEVRYTYRITAVDEVGRESRPATVRSPK